MALKYYVWIWSAVSLFFGYEYVVLNWQLGPSVLKMLETHHILHFKVSPEAGRPLSLYLGWVGLGAMIIMNVYSLRKRTSFLKNYGKLSQWLNFHVFCGLVGPTFILFHCNFKVRGLVGIAFWSMMISFTSGIVGRYFYLQIVMKKADFQKESEAWLRRLRRFLEKAKVQWNAEAYGPFIAQAMVTAGVPRQRGGNAFAMFYQSVAGDWRLRFSGVDIPEEWPDRSEIALMEYAVSVRRAATLESFQRLMGYWHAFHFPFAIFMYVAAAFHVAASLIFG